MNPKISVIMGIYNCEDTLKIAIDSIINQDYKNWELIMCDDGSTDCTYKIANEYLNKYKEKIVLIKNDENKGLNYTLNKCLALAKGDYIARMDADDISLSNRFSEQVKVLEKNKDIAIVSCNMVYFDESGEWGQCKLDQYPSTESFIYGTPFCHAPCMVRQEAYRKVEGYTDRRILLRVEDYHLWIKMYHSGYKGMNINKVLYKMKDDRSTYKRRKFKYRINEMYVRYLAFKMLKLDKKKSWFIFRPIIVGLMPRVLYTFLHKKNLEKVGS